MRYSCLINFITIHEFEEKKTKVIDDEYRTVFVPIESTIICLSRGVKKSYNLVFCVDPENMSKNDLRKLFNMLDPTTTSLVREIKAINIHHKIYRIPCKTWKEIKKILEKYREK